MKRRPLCAAGSFGLYALCICLSTLLLQALTAPAAVSDAAPSFLSALNPLDVLLRGMTGLASTAAGATEIRGPSLPVLDLRIGNLSVHRVRYVDDQSEAVEVSSVVATWEDHPLAARARGKNARLEDEAVSGTAGMEAAAVDVDASESYSYELQLWVTGWGLDALWHPANRRVITLDPFVVLTDLPPEHELRFRVRVKARQRASLGFLLLPGIFATETDGPWSDTATLAPSQDDALEAILAFLASNKALSLLLSSCIGLGSLLVLQLYLRSRLEDRRLQRQQQKPKMKLLAAPVDSDIPREEDAGATESKSKEALEHEIRDLRQELEDSEAEVRQLMLFSGYGIETLAPTELGQLERELQNTLRRVQQLKNSSVQDRESMSEIEQKGLDEGHGRGAEEQNEQKHRTLLWRPRMAKRRATTTTPPLSPIQDSSLSSSSF